MLIFRVDVAVWNTNGTSVDMLLKHAELADAGRLMSDANVTYAVLIHDLQRDIEAENPPAAVIQQLQNRKGTHGKIFVVDFMEAGQVRAIVCKIVNVCMLYVLNVCSTGLLVLFFIIFRIPIAL